MQKMCFLAKSCASPFFFRRNSSRKINEIVSVFDMPSIQSKKFSAALNLQTDRSNRKNYPQKPDRDQILNILWRMLFDPFVVFSRKSHLFIVSCLQKCLEKFTKATRNVPKNKRKNVIYCFIQSFTV